MCVYGIDMVHACMYCANICVGRKAGSVSPFSNLPLVAADVHSGMVCLHCVRMHAKFVHIAMPREGTDLGTRCHQTILDNMHWASRNRLDEKKGDDVVEGPASSALLLPL